LFCKKVKSLLITEVADLNYLLQGTDPSLVARIPWLGQWNRPLSVYPFEEVPEHAGLEIRNCHQLQLRLHV
jgi:hypothetical protein